MGSQKSWIVFLLLFVIGIGYISYEHVYLKPQTSVELYEEIAFANNFEQAKKVMVDDNKAHFSEEDFKVLNEIDSSPNKIRQLTLVEYDDETFVFSTTPGTKKLEVFAVGQLPPEIREYFLQLLP